MAEFLTVIKEFKRMCCFEESCEECVFGLAWGEGKCEHWLVKMPEEAEKIIMDWAAEHPVATLKSKFFEMFPNAPKLADGTPQDICPHNLGWADECADTEKCADCWNRPYEERRNE